MHGSRWRGLETERGTRSRALGWDNRPGNRRQHKGPRPYTLAKRPRQSPTLLTFRARKARSRQGKNFTNFLPAISKDALKKISSEVRRWRLHLRTGHTIGDLARKLNPIVRGWLQYYGAFYRSALYPFLQRINAYLVRYLRKKYKRLRPFNKALASWQRITSQHPRLFAHWAWTRNAW